MCRWDATEAGINTFFCRSVAAWQHIHIARTCSSVRPGICAEATAPTLRGLTEELAQIANDEKLSCLPIYGFHGACCIMKDAKGNLLCSPC